MNNYLDKHLNSLHLTILYLNGGLNKGLLFVILNGYAIRMSIIWIFTVPE